MSTLNVDTIDTPIGSMVAAATSKNLHLLLFADMPNVQAAINRIAESFGFTVVLETNTIIEQVKTQLIEYFKGTRKSFEIPLYYQGTPFQIRVWDTLRTIPYQLTITYNQLAIRLGDKNCIRAAAKANGNNPILVVVPCHRVVGKDGKLTGYAGGLSRKQMLLELESALSRPLI